MYEQEINEIKNLSIEVNQALIDYEETQVSATTLSGDKLKSQIDALIRVVSKVSLLMHYITQVRLDLVYNKSSVSASTKLILQQLLDELRLQLESCKTTSFNYTTILNALRDKFKLESNIHN
jgi:predicted ATPase